MRPAIGLSVLLLLAACGEDEAAKQEQGNLVRQNVYGNQIAAETPPEGPPPQLEALGSDEVEQAGLAGAGCDFSMGETLLLVAVEGGAIAKVRGRVVRLVHAGPVEASGGFFASPQVRISVGRTEPEQGQASGETMSWPAAISVTSPQSGEPYRLEGRWSCGS